MNAPAASAPALFASVRSSKDLTLVAFVGALLVGSALYAGAFIPRLTPAESAAKPASIEPAPRSPAPAVMARRPAAGRGASAASAEPCDAPRG